MVDPTNNDAARMVRTVFRIVVSFKWFPLIRYRRSVTRNRTCQVRLVWGSDSVGGCSRGPHRLTIASFLISKFVILIGITFKGRQNGTPAQHLPSTDSHLAVRSPYVVSCLFNSRPAGSAWDEW